VKLFNQLLFSFSLFLPFQIALGNVVFPTRGFSPILDHKQAAEKLDKFKDFFFQETPKEFSHLGYLYRFKFTHYPKEGEATTHHGLLSGPAPESTTQRVDFFSLREETSPHLSFLLSRGLKKPQVWRWSLEMQSPKILLAEDWLTPWLEGINHTPFDLLMPFLSWPNEYEKSGRVCGRPAHLFIFNPPSGNPFSQTKLTSIRLAIDHVYPAPLRVQHMDGGILPARTFSLQSFKKVDEQWVVKTIDVKDRDSGSTTRFELEAVAHGIDLHESTFQGGQLNRPLNQSSINFQNL